MLELSFFDGNIAVAEMPSALLQSDITSDGTFVSATLVDTSIDRIVTSGFNFLPLLRGKFAPMPPLLAFSNASILLTAFDTLIDDVVLMKLLLLMVWLMVGVIVVIVVVGVVDVEEDVSDVRFPVVSASMSAVILTICLLVFLIVFFFFVSVFVFGVWFSIF